MLLSIAWLIQMRYAAMMEVVNYLSRNLNTFLTDYVKRLLNLLWGPKHFLYLGNFRMNALVLFEIFLCDSKTVMSRIWIHLKQPKACGYVSFMSLLYNANIEVNFCRDIQAEKRLNNHLVEWLVIISWLRPLLRK